MLNHVSGDGLVIRALINQCGSIDTAPPRDAQQYFRPASLRNGWFLVARDVFASNDSHRNKKLVRTGFLLIFQRINYKNIRLHYTLAILRSHWSVVVLSLRKENPVLTVLFLCGFPSTLYQQHGQNEGNIFIIFYFNSAQSVGVVKLRLPFDISASEERHRH